MTLIDLFHDYKGPLRATVPQLRQPDSRMLCNTESGLALLIDSLADRRQHIQENGCWIRLVTLYSEVGLD
jgi:hypothetical protein